MKNVTHISDIYLYRKKRKLFWVSTKDGDEDWFIIAYTAKQACKFHEDYEGYDNGDAKAKPIMTVNKIYSKDRTYHAQLWMLVDMGFEILSDNLSRIVRRAGIIYQEGTTLKSVLMKRTYENEGLYIVNTAGTSNYKIGITKDFSKRLSNLQTGTPFVIELHNFYPTKDYKKLERILHKKYKKFSIGREWFRLAEKELNEIHDLIIAYK